MNRKKFHKIKALLVLLIMSVPLQSFAKTFRIYFRDSKDAKLSLYLWYGMGDNQVKPAGEWAVANQDNNTETIGGKTWRYFEFDTDNDYGNATVKNNGTVSAIIRKHNTDGTISAQTVDIYNLSAETYLLTEGTLTTEWVSGNKKTAMLFHDITLSEAEGKTVNYVVKMSCGGVEKSFYMTNVRNQEPKIHSINTSLFTVGIKDADLPGNKGDKVNFYIAGSDDGQTYADGSTISNQFRSWSDYDFTKQASTIYNYYYNCKGADGSNFQLTKGAGVSYTICLNNSHITDIDYHANNLNDDQKALNPNKPVGCDEHTDYKKRSVSVYVNQALTEDNEGYTLIGNFLKVNDPNADNQGLNKDDSWSPTDPERQHKMSKITSFDSSVGDEGDIVYECKLNKPASSMNTMFFNICPNTLLNRTDMTWGSSSEGKYSTDKWNWIIRPQVQAGKDAIALQGCVEITPTQVKTEDGKEECVVMNRSQAFNANLDDNNYSQFTVYLNLTKSTYTIVPEESIDLIGNAVGIINRGSGEWQQGQWENGERQYHYVRMARNKELDYTNNETEQTTKCWEYTGKFYQYDVAGGRGGENASNGFRFLTNQTYVRNYIEDEYRPEHFTETQKKATDYEEKYAVNNPYWNEVMLDPYNAVGSMKNPMKPYNPNGSPIYGGLGNERDEGLHIGFVLPTGIYTMRFWQTKDKEGNIVKTWYTLGENITPPNKLPDNTDVYDDLNCIRTFSSANSYKKPDNMRVFIVDAYSNGQAHLKEISYIPANTGVILAYNSDKAETIKKNPDNLEFVGEADQEDQSYIFEKFPSINFVETTEKTDIGTNYLMPSIASKTIETTEFADESKETLAYRNYMFTAYKKKGEDKYTLCFKRVITGKTSPNSAYLRLPANICGGTKMTTNDEKIIGSSAQFPDYNPQSAKECFASISWAGNQATGISDITMAGSTPQSKTYYTLQGVKVKKPSAPGIYIMDGKKIIIR